MIGWLRENPTLGIDAAAERLADVAHVEAPSRRDAVLRARDYLKQLYRSMYDQGHIAANDWVSLRVAARRDLPVPRDLRPKNAYNLIRLLDLGIRWLSGETPDVRVPEHAQTDAALDQERRHADARRDGTREGAHAEARGRRARGHRCRSAAMSRRPIACCAMCAPKPRVARFTSSPVRGASTRSSRPEAHFDGNV